ncbi:MAG: hypothetical protein ACKVQS_10735 [Fimbriimonadaceae bacterium]
MRLANVLILIPLIALSACDAEPSIKGTWEATDGRPVTLIFGEGTAEWSVEMIGQSIAISGTYTRDRNRVIIKNLELPGGKDFAKMLAPKIAEVNLEVGVDAMVSFKTNDEIVLTGDKLIDGSYRRITKTK